MRQGWTPGAAARQGAPPLRHTYEAGRYRAAAAFHPAALMLAALGPSLGAALLVLARAAL
ncbi:hypothetical protein [Methylobacterium isbiliense]|jgi:hypothetical protein|uniref:Uncharacterized protein n=1 Tax=Methylobacterium isbiliense TaxID=315478 RepID=A0ABQ4SMZ2_9HYPH|nr:hypothetical protein [Methylobacterium isbiliense]MDN3627260.1 hypothetical protein [Methylobacterium isbiliense]GJE04500.1 hypothetical protein GMJLKIPL_6464 [Methylobacterium isbiliense]